MIEAPSGIEIEDPRPIAADAPYTFFLPFEAELAALRPNDGIKAIFRQTIGDGTLDNKPAGMDAIKQGDRVRIPLTYAGKAAQAAINTSPCSILWARGRTMTR